MDFLKKTALLVLFSLALISCNKKDSDKTDIKENGKKEENRTVSKSAINFEGNYVTDDYAKRNEDFDWSAVSIIKKTDSTFYVSIRSRADNKKPSCTFDAYAVMSDNGLKALLDGNKIVFTLDKDVLTITTENPEDIDKLMYYCSGGANIAGNYTRINEPLDQTQIDKRIFQKFLTLQDISFEVYTTGEGSIQNLVVQPSGLKSDNKAITTEIDGSVTNAEIEDLNSDGYPELLIYTTSAGSGSYGNVIAYSVKDGKSMSPVYFPPVSGNPVAKEGYMGHDEFAVVETDLVQKFPVYKEGDTNSKPTGNIRQISYKLVDGETSGKFVADKIIEIIPE
ncbi:MAG TPA: PliI family lysozyme inhibitor of I-type lysozyme [Ignavibacteria bacterium]|nr:PliI family lysozyme inhibitor of I-type lysozyme [Ignavibacteria bacterium]HMR40453.1 PliI family lysozyme inhibitor of I-type lysozyme [Ignavibacteria bacterium]